MRADTPPVAQAALLLDALQHQTGAVDEAEAVVATLLADVCSVAGEEGVITLQLFPATAQVRLRVLACAAPHVTPVAPRALQQLRGLQARLVMARRAAGAAAHARVCTPQLVDSMSVDAQRLTAAAGHAGPRAGRERHADAEARRSVRAVQRLPVQRAATQVSLARLCWLHRENGEGEEEAASGAQQAAEATDAGVAEGVRARARRGAARGAVP